MAQAQAQARQKAEAMDDCIQPHTVEGVGSWHGQKAQAGGTALVARHSAALYSGTLGWEQAVRMHGYEARREA